MLQTKPRRNCRICQKKLEKQGAQWVHLTQKAKALCGAPVPYATKRKPKRTSLRSQCDALASLNCKRRAGYRCERCGKSGEPNARGERVIGLEWSHRPSAKRSKTLNARWDDDAADCLCHSCHTYLEKRPAEYNAWLVSRGVDVMDLERRANELWNREYPLARLKEAAKEAA